MDISLPKIMGLSVIDKLKELDFNGQIIVLSMFEEDEYGIQSIQRGVSLFVKTGCI